MGLSPGTMVTANVRLVEPMAHGGMGSVWLADHLGLDAKVAVKFINAELVGREPGLEQRFKREASICARLKSVHVVQTFDHGMMNDGTPYIVMERLEGRTFTRLVEDAGRRSPRQVGVIVAQIGKVLHRAHDLGIVHRDIKPDNIFVVDDDYEMFIKVLDFGIAKTPTGDGEVVTKTGAVVGSPEFMSPEQALNSKEVDSRADLYSLAVVAYYGLTGALPFEEDDERPFWIQLSSGEHVPATQRVADLPTAIDAWFERALAPKPQDRFQSARELADSFGHIVEEEGAGPVSTLASSEVPQHLQSADLELSEQETVRMSPIRERETDSSPVSVVVRDEIGSAPTMHATPSEPEPRMPMPSFARVSEAPPWSTIQPPPRRPTWVVVVLSIAAIALVIGALLLLTAK